MAAREGCMDRDTYEDLLEVNCDSGNPATLTWTPDDSTPDLVYYQVSYMR